MREVTVPRREPAGMVASAPRLLPVLLVVLVVFGPISMDLYLPVLPALTDELGAVPSMAQLTMTTCLIGLAAGQLIAGPVSDRYGRRKILIAGIVAYILTSLLCALSPTIELLVLTRLVQGLAGGVGIVIASAAGRDVYSGPRLIRFYGRLTVMGSSAAIVGPLLGGQLAQVTDWRGLFVFLAVIGVVLLVVTLAGFPETLAPQNRTSGGLAQTGRDFRVLAGDRIFLGAVLNQGFVFAALFAYLAGATYVLQGHYGLSPQQYSFAFGFNSVGSVVFGFLAARTAERWSLRGTLYVGLAVAAVGALGVVLAGIVDVPVVVVLVSLFLLASGGSITSTPATTLALTEYPQMAGTASSLLGVVRFGFGGISAPLVGIAGATAILPLGVVATVCVALAALAFGVFAHRGQQPPKAP
ncbi:multidrug effflux MFS transporter [Actinoplanes couchii]|uniref:Bcr/CflA family drug resistance efflux transporter n=1 Tax=Actinoplanes couchii TaxID=403638 RepID=A0ABQ3XHX6_9ACTN|nr:multidrug effflux MFS transporter [Actinoplanes couchii]MDR6317721.1 DHA1 family bicyclomycin/chloramphenicol resistance-like MFS transporter [Actinoplanes couchii]GID58105.1 Bcr/CflA family drug resistance efflux transporter [Actinoplanes couchii]